MKPLYTEEQHAEWERQAAAVDVERVREVVDRRMWRHEAENEIARRLGLTIAVSIYLVSRAAKLGVIAEDLGHVCPR